MRALFALAAVALVGLVPAAASAQLTCCGHHRARVVAVAYVQPTATVSMPANVSYAVPMAVCHGMSYAPTVANMAAPTYSVPYTVAAPMAVAPAACTGYAPSYGPTYGPTYAPGYAMPYSAAPGCQGPAGSASAPGDVNDSIVKLTVAVGQLTRLVTAHTDVLTDHTNRLRALESRTKALLPGKE